MVKMMLKIIRSQLLPEKMRFENTKKIEILLAGATHARAFVSFSLRKPRKKGMTGSMIPKFPAYVFLIVV
jgi:hypothetical protein